MSRIRSLMAATLLAGLSLAGCSSVPEQKEAGTYLPIVTDERDAPFEIAKAVEGGGVRLYVGETFFGQDLIDLFHREVALQSPRLPKQHKLEVTRLEVSVLVSGGNFLIDPSRELIGADRYRPAPGSLVLDELGPDTRQTVRVQIGYRLDGRTMFEAVEGEATAVQVREVAGNLYRDAITRVVGRLQKNG